MKRLVSIIVLLVALHAHAQPANGPFFSIADGSVPSGSCGSTIGYLGFPSGNITTCKSGTWTVTSGGSGTFVALTGDATSTSTGGATEVIGILNHALPALSTGYLNWNGTAWAFSAVSGSGFPITLGSTSIASGSTTTAITGLSVNGVTLSAAGANTTYLNGAGGYTTPAGSGTVTSFSAGNLSPLFTSSVATATSTPALTFTLSNAAQNSILAGPATGGAGAPSYQTAPTFSAANLTSFPTFNQSTTGNAATATALASTPTLCSTGNAPTGILANGNATGCAAIGGGSGTVTSVSVTTANGVSGTVATSTTTPAITLTLGAITPSSVTTSGTTPGAISAVAGTGSIPALTANSAGFAAPVTGGTAFLYKLPATAAAGILHAAAPGTVDGVNESALTSSAVSLTADVSGILPVANGGSGTASPAIVAGTNVTVSGTWPNQTINATGSGGVSSFTGDGKILTNSASTGAVTATVGPSVILPNVYIAQSGPTTFTTINASFSNVATTLTVVSTTGYVVPTTGHLFLALYHNAFTSVEVIDCPGTITGTTFSSCARAQGGTTAAAWVTGDTVAELSYAEYFTTTGLFPQAQIWNGGRGFYPGSDDWGFMVTSANITTTRDHIFYAQDIESGTNGVSVKMGSDLLLNLTDHVDTAGIIGENVANLAVTAIATTIAPVTPVVNLTGVAPTALATITAPSGACTTTGVTCNITFLGVGFVTVLTGNIGNVITVAANVPGECWYLQSATKWYCK